MALTKPRAYQIYDIDYKQAVRVVSLSNVTLSGGAPNSVDGVNLSLNDRILVAGQTSGAQNGIYYVTTVGTGANGTWARSTDTDATGELLSGTIVMVTEGTTYADTQWKLTTNDPITIGSTALTFVQNYLANSISYGNTAFAIGSTNANATISVAGTSNVAVFATDGEYVTGLISATANITGGNLLTSGIVSAASYIGSVVSVTANITGGNVLTGGQVSATGNITSAGNVSGTYLLGNVFFATGISANKIYNGTTEVAIGTASGNANITVGGTSNVVVFATTGQYVTGLISASGNITSAANVSGGNLLTGGLISATGNVTSAGNVSGTYLLGNVFYATGISASKIYNGTSEANIGTSGGNANITIGGISNVVVFATTGEYVTGLISASGNITSAANIAGGNVLATTIVSGASLLGSLVSVSGNITGGNINTNGLISAAGNVTGANIVTGGSVSSIGNIYAGTANAGYVFGNATYMTGISAAISVTKIENGNSNVWVNSPGGDVTVTAGGVSNVAVFSTGSMTLQGAFGTPKTISANVVVADNINAMLIGPLVFGNGYGLTVPTSSTVYIYSPNG